MRIINKCKWQPLFNRHLEQLNFWKVSKEDVNLILRKKLFQSTGAMTKQWCEPQPFSLHETGELPKTLPTCMDWASQMDYILHTGKILRVPKLFGLTQLTSILNFTQYPTNHQCNSHIIVSHDYGDLGLPRYKPLYFEPVSNRSSKTK